ncbi:HlyC/CorC family transporter [Pseudoalteromonas sp. SG45-5]|uniref:hemolysin family protein n=1 Tax=unclassified Pseudoalteromonas TaxID=194690 RepID=UPI0015FCF2FD|nr:MULTISPECIES: hemolysin family protein [unclassified Pseudoalteromonas]MBB1386954.1 HlyC/CorC family transporter [Pseudoalteromonas sp. SG45-5]MBB1395122.1 HlyC/CorC family transporter [Pseudoalteromonas sp. SG44-4]MBB1447022.1 HlyC/CorC family transporter [Pseudoalteromonas sp. SG41-6]
MTLLIVYMVVAIVISFLCSVMEAVLLSISPSYVASLKKEHPEFSKQLETLKSNIDEPLAAILTLNTVAHTAGAAGVGAQAAVVFSDAAVGIASAIMTLLVLVLSEIIPKTLGANYWRVLTPSVTYALRFLVILLKPFVWCAQKLTNLMRPAHNEAYYIRQEIEAMADIGTESGALHEDESEIIRNLLHFRHAKLCDLMTPRTVLFKVHKDLTVNQYLNDYGSSSFSRILVFDKDSDDIVGFVHKNDIMLAFHRLGTDYKISKLVKPIYTVPSSHNVSSLLQTLLTKRTHICLVVDEYGDVLGIVTLEDLMEALMGLEIVDERDQSTNMRAVAKQQWRKRLANSAHIVSETDKAPEKDH